MCWSILRACFESFHCYRTLTSYFWCLCVDAFLLDLNVLTHRKKKQSFTTGRSGPAGLQNHILTTAHLCHSMSANSPSTVENLFCHMQIFNGPVLNVIIWDWPLKSYLTEVPLSLHLLCLPISQLQNLRESQPWSLLGLTPSLLLRFANWSQPNTPQRQLRCGRLNGNAHAFCLVGVLDFMGSPAIVFQGNIIFCGVVVSNLHRTHAKGLVLSKRRVSAF